MKHKTKMLLSKSLLIALQHANIETQSTVNG